MLNIGMEDKIIFEGPKLSRNKRNGFANFRITLNVPYREKDTVKSLGGRWDKEKKTWYVIIDHTRSIRTFEKWLASPIIE